MLSPLLSRHPLVLYPFRYFDERRQKWIRARYVAELHVIAERHARWEITGAPEIRASSVGAFNPFRQAPVDANAELVDAASISELESSFVRIFLRRYVNWCALKRRYLAMNSSAELLRALP